MRYVLKSSIAFLLAVVIFAGMLPATALAANGERVLTSIRHSSAVAAVNVEGSTLATLTVPNSYSSGTINLSQDLDITYDTSLYSFASPNFPNPTVVVDGDPVDMVVTYQKKGDETLYKTTYTINVVRAAKVLPVFSGTITKSVTLSRSLTFTVADFADRYVKNDGGVLSSVVITGSNPTFGTLKWGGSDYVPGVAVSIADLTGGKLTFAATSAGTVSYVVEAYAADDLDTLIGPVVLKITAERVAATFSGTITKSVTLPASLTFTATDFSSKYTKNDGGELASITVTGSNPTFGKLRLGSSDYASGSTISVSDLSSGRLTFVATSSGTVSYTVKAYASGDAATPIGSVTLTITVQGSMVANVAYTTDAETPVTFDASDFNDVCDDATGETLSYVRFTLPSSSYGKLYYNYTSLSDYDSVVSSSTKYYRNSSLYLSTVTFVPKSGYYGTVSITYTGYNTDGDSYTGVIKITARENLGADDVTYATTEGTAVTFDASDFSSVCDDLTGETLSYVKFTLPSSSYGKLYYNYTSSSDYDSAVSSSTKYCRNSSLYLSKVTFVPKSGYTGTVSIAYTGYNTDGESYTGKVKITVQATADDITYSTEVNAGVTFKASDFNDVCDDATDETLSYVKFKLPSSIYGKIYYDYTSSSDYGSSVSASSKYYRNSSPYLSRVTFVPKSGYAGTVSIAYTGYSAGGETYTGTVKIVAKESDGSSRYFDDVGTSYSWAAEAIDYLYKAGVVTGVGTGRYDPSASITRGDFMVMLCRAFNLKAGIAGNFNDVEVGSYYFNSIAIAKALGIATGDGVNFKPTYAITRQDAMVLVARTLNITAVPIATGYKSDLAGFSDGGEVSDYAISAAASLVKADIIRGTAGKLNPKGSITRSEMAVILYRVLTMR